MNDAHVQPNPGTSAIRTWFRRSIHVIVLPIFTAILLYYALYPVLHVPVHPSNQNKISSWLVHMEVIGLLDLLGPEDLVHDPERNVIYTGCASGEIKQFTLSDIPSKTTFKTIVFTGGRPLGLTLGNQNNLLVADADKGLLDVSLNDGKLKVLSTEAGGKRFKIVDGVTQANDGMIYFTDASYKCDLHEHLLDIIERNPYGRLMSYNPKTNETKVLLNDLYFANGVTMMPNQKALIFCETSMYVLHRSLTLSFKLVRFYNETVVRARCSKYFIKGDKRGKIEAFADDLPGLPDAIHYDKDGGLFWIALSMDILGSQSPYIAGKNLSKVVLNGKRPGGILVVDSTGETKTFYYDPELSLITSVIRVQNYAYVGSATYPYCLRVDLARQNSAN